MNAASYQEEILHEALNGPTPITRDRGQVVEVTESLPVGIGPPAVQPFISGKTQNVRTTWVEQGWGHDSQRWPSYPYSVLDNPARKKSPVSKLSDEQRVNLAIGAFDPVFGPNNLRQDYWAAYRQSGAHVHGALVGIPPMVPYTDTVPSYSGGGAPHPGIDIPLGVLYQ